MHDEGPPPSAAGAFVVNVCVPAVHGGTAVVNYAPRTLTGVSARLGTGGRLLGVDVARSLALIGMMSVHIFFPAFDADGSMHPAYVIAAGRSAALFATLAGVGIALASGGSTPYDGRRLRGARAGVLARSVLLVALGLQLGRVDSPPLVILAFYGLLFVLAIPFLAMSARGLAVLALSCALVTPLASYWWRLVVSPTPIAEPAAGTSSRSCSSPAPTRLSPGRPTCSWGWRSGAATCAATGSLLHC